MVNLERINKHNNENSAILLLSIIYIIVIILAYIFLLTGSMDYAYGFFMMALFSIPFITRMKKRGDISVQTVVAFFLRFGISIIYTMSGDGDADYYGVNAEWYAGLPLSQLFSNIPTNAYLYSWIISFFFRVFGTFYMPVRVLNSAISIYCVWIVYDITKEIYGGEIAKKAAWIVAVFPNLIRWSSLFANREVFIMLFMLLYIKASYKYYARGNIRYLIFSLIFLIPAMILHTSMIVMILLTILIILKKRGSHDYATAMLSKSFLIMTSLIAFTYLLRNGIGVEKFSLIEDSGLSMNNVSAIGNMSATGRAAYLTNFRFSNPILIILTLPVRMLYFLFTPFPWMISASIDIAGFFDALLYVWAFIPALKKVKRISISKKRTKEETFVYILFIALICIIAMFALVTSNYGTAIRHRSKLFVILLIIVANDIRIPFRLKAP